MKDGRVEEEIRRLMRDGAELSRSLEWLPQCKLLIREYECCDSSGRQSPTKSSINSEQRILCVEVEVIVIRRTRPIRSISFPVITVSTCSKPSVVHSVSFHLITLFS